MTNGTQSMFVDFVDTAFSQSPDFTPQTLYKHLCIQEFVSLL